VYRRFLKQHPVVLQFRTDWRLFLGTGRNLGWGPSLPERIAAEIISGGECCIWYLGTVFVQGQRHMTKLHGEDYFAKLRAGFEIGMCGRGFGESKNPIDHWF